MPTNTRHSQLPAQVASSGSQTARFSQVAVQVASAGLGAVLLSQVVVQVVSATAPAATRVTQTGSYSAQQADIIRVTATGASVAYQKHEIIVTQIGLYIVQGGQVTPPQPPADECVIALPSLNCWGESDQMVSCLDEHAPASADCWSEDAAASTECLDEQTPTRGACWSPHTGPPSFGLLGDDE